MIYITGDCHGEFGKIRRFCMEMGTAREDIMIILGDAGINISNGLRDLRESRCCHRFPIPSSASTATMKCGLPG